MPRRGPLAPLVLAVLAVLLACGSAPVRHRIRIVHTNDLHGHIERAATVAAVAADERRKHPHSLFLDAGDAISGTPVSTVFQGRPIFEIMSAMGYDAAALGNHELDHGHALIPEFREIAGFPLLCANAGGPDGTLLADAADHVFEVGAVRVGVLGLITEHVPSMTVASATQGCRFEDPVDAARRLVPGLRERCDVVVLLTHLGVRDDAALAGAVPGIDLIVGGHSHTELGEALVVGSTRIVQAKCYGERVGVVDLVWDAGSRSVTEVTSRLVEIEPDSMPSDERVRELVAAWEAKVDGQVSEVVGRTDRRIGRKALRQAIERAYRERLGTDLGYQNESGVRADVAAGEIRIRDVWTVLPFDNTLVRLRVKGVDLREHFREQLGRRFDPDATYTIATSSFVADHPAKYLGTDAVEVEDTGLLMRDEVVAWVRENGGFQPAREDRAREGGGADDQDGDRRPR